MTTITKIVTTLTLGLQPKQGAWKGEGQECNPKVTFPLSGVQESVKDWTHTFSNGLPFWEFKYWGTFQSLENDLKGQNLDWRVIYTIGNILRHKCIKWNFKTPNLGIPKKTTFGCSPCD
jgi:hypothetical protein